MQKLLKGIKKKLPKSSKRCKNFLTTLHLEIASKIFIDLLFMLDRERKSIFTKSENNTRLSS